MRYFQKKKHSVTGLITFDGRPYELFIHEYKNIYNNYVHIIMSVGWFLNREHNERCIGFTLCVSGFSTRNLAPDQHQSWYL